METRILSAVASDHGSLVARYLLALGRRARAPARRLSTMNDDDTPSFPMLLVLLTTTPLVVSILLSRLGM